MPEVEKYEVLALGSGGAGKFIAWTMAKDGHKAAMVDPGPWEGLSERRVPSEQEYHLLRQSRVARSSRP